MNPHRLKAYLNLIQELLTCPSDEEWIRLRQHEDLVNLELVQIMEQVANQLATEGNGDAARFLHNWAGRLYHILAQPLQQPSDDPQTEAYLDLIQALLTSPKSARGKLLAKHQALIGPGLVQTMQQVSAQMEAQGNRRAGQYLRQLAAELNHQWLQAQEFQSDLAKMTAREQEQPFQKHSEDTKRKPLTRESVESLEPQSAKEIATPAAKPTKSSKVAKEKAAAPNQEETIPDPWEDSLASETPKTPSAESDGDPVGATAPAVDTATYAQIAQQLGAITTALDTLNEHMAQQATQRDPLWYMETLERAQEGGWLMATEEVEQLIGVKPSSSGKEEHFDRGCWRFVKTGKIGAQTAWRVEKLDVASQ